MTVSVQETPPSERLFACPSCGGTEWWAHYKVPTAQLVKLVADEDGVPSVQDYLGDEKAFDPDPDEWFQCADATCGAEVNLDGSPR